MIGDDDEDDATGIKLAQVCVHHRVEGIGANRARRIFVLHVIGGRQIHEIGPHAAQQFDTGGEDELRQFGRIDIGYAHADQPTDIGDAVFGEVHLAGSLRREGHRRTIEEQALAEQQAELVLRRDHGDARPLFLEGFENRRRPQPFRVVHHRLLAGGRIDEIIAADAVDSGRLAGSDRQVVGIGEARDHRMAPQVGTLGDDAPEVRHQSGRHRHFHIGGLAAIATDDDEWS